MFKWLYHKKTRGGFEITRVLFFKFKKKRPETDDKVVMPVPPVKNVGRCTYYDKDLCIENPETVIGAFCSIGAHVSLGHGEHPIDYLTTSPYFYFDFLGWKDKSAPAHNELNDLRPIIVGNDVWIGEGAFVKNGVTIGDGAVIGAKSVVTRDVPPYAVVAGVPAKVVRYRFDAQTIKELLALQWWNLADDVLRRVPYDDIRQALAFLKEHKK